MVDISLGEVLGRLLLELESGFDVGFMCAFANLESLRSQLQLVVVWRIFISRVAAIADYERVVKNPE